MRCVIILLGLVEGVGPIKKRLNRFVIRLLLNQYVTDLVVARIRMNGKGGPYAREGQYRR